MFNRFRNSPQQQKDDLEKFRALRQLMGQAAELRFPEKRYEKGWQDCLIFLGQSKRAPTHQVPVTRARQQSLTHKTSDRYDETGGTAG